MNEGSETSLLQLLKPLVNVRYSETGGAHPALLHSNSWVLLGSLEGRQVDTGGAHAI